MSNIEREMRKKKTEKITNTIRNIHSHTQTRTPTLKQIADRKYYCSLYKN